MHTLTPRHRRKAGSGPPANALMAWIGTDPYLRDAATTANHRCELDLPLPSRARVAAAAVAVCFLLTCGAVVGITQIISHGRVPPITPSQHRLSPAGAGQLQPVKNQCPSCSRNADRRPWPPPQR